MNIKKKTDPFKRVPKSVKSIPKSIPKSIKKSLKKVLDLNKYDEYIPTHPSRELCYKKFFQLLIKYNTNYNYEHDYLQKLALNIEKSIFNSSLTGNNNWDWKFEHYYKSKSVRVFSNLNPDNPIKNTNLVHKLLSHEINGTDIVDFSSSEIFPEKHQELLEKIGTDFDGITPKVDPETLPDGQFRCFGCRSWKTTYFELQIKSGDENMTAFVTCHNCTKRFRVG